MTVLGSFTALFFASELIIVFKGKGLVPDEVMQLIEFPVAVGLGAAFTVMFATKFGLPVSTTHALIGSLSGAGFMASSTGINFEKLLEKFFLPLIGGPLISLVLAILLYPFLTHLRKKLKVKRSSCLCVGSRIIATSDTVVTNVSEFQAIETQNVDVKIGDDAYCRDFYNGSFFGFSFGKTLDSLHYISGGLVSFARGLNDTPKIAALLLLGSRFSLNYSILIVGVAMLVGGLIHSRKIASTMGDKVTDMNPGQAFTANLVTSIMVFGASKLGVPVSTTHVSCGSIFGIGIISKKAKINVILQILFAWITTLPLGFMLGLIIMWFLL
jgi:PiT family inorganic phosphate transporter